MPKKIDTFDSQIWLKGDGSLDIKETVSYDFGTENKHGIYRYIPYKYTRDSRPYKIRFDFVSVRDEKGQVYPYEESYLGNNFRLKIGDPNTTITGLRTYVISYKVRGAVGFLKEFDEIYWNVTGNDWPVAMSDVSATVYLPNSFQSSDVKATGYVGKYGSQSTVLAYMSEQEGYRIIKFFSGRPVEAGEGLTVAADFPKGFAAPPSAAANIWYRYGAYLYYLIPITFFAFLFSVWLKKRRATKGRGTVVAQYDVPDNLTPLEVGTLIDEKCDNRDVSAEIVYLATKGYIKINRIEKKNIFGKADYEFEKLKSGADLPREFDRYFMQHLFNSKDKVKLSEKENNFYTYLQSIRDKVNAELVRAGYFEANPAQSRLKYFIAAAGAVMLVFFAGQFASDLVFPMLITSGLLFIFGFLASYRSQRGVFTKEYILGLKEYLMVAEKARIDFHNAPEKNPQTFEKFLPYAMVLGVEKEWAKQFEGILTEPPAWYGGYIPGTFSGAGFIHDMDSFGSRVGSGLAVAPSASSGGSGGGGGFSGGGFGGGGGGSW